MTDTAARFWAKTTEDPTTGCLLWTGATSTKGYGQVSHAGRTRSAHRVAYEITVGPIPDGAHLDHLCRVRRCVNPDHLEPVTQKVNAERAGAAHTHCPAGHPLAGPNVLTTTAGRRNCRACHITRQRAKATTGRAPYRNRLDLTALLAQATEALEAA